MAEKRREDHAADESVISSRKAKRERYRNDKASKTPAISEKAVFTWHKRIDWSSVAAGVFVAVAIQLVLGAASAFTGFGVASVANVNDLENIANGVGMWATVSAFVASFAGAYFASRLTGTLHYEEGLLYGLFVWAILTTSGILLSALGIGGLLGFAGNAVFVLRSVISSGSVVSLDDVNIASTVAVTLTRYFFTGALLSLGTAMLGGWLGFQQQSSDQKQEGREQSESNDGIAA